MSREVHLVRRQSSGERRVFLSRANQENGTPHPPIGGMEGVPVFSGNRVNSRERKKAEDSSSSILDVERKALGMTKADRQALLDRLALSLHENESGRDSSMWLLAVVGALQAHLGAGGASAYGPAVAKAHVAASKVFKPVADFIRLVGLDEFSVPERQAALNYLASLVVEDAAALAKVTRIPLGPKMVGQRQANVNAIFDQAFPSYLAAGLGKIIFRRMATAEEWDGPKDIAS